MKNAEITLDVQGMTCPSCIHHVRTALSELDGVAKVDVRLRDGKVAVQYDPKAIQVPALISALLEAGYDATPSAAA